MSEGVREITIHARVEAVSFYEALGYGVTGESFIEIGIAHRTMTKHLPWSPA